MTVSSVPFHPFSPEFLKDPYPHYRVLRETAPVYHIPDTDIWMVTRHADCDSVLRRHEIFSSTGGVGPEWDPHPMLSMYDPPEHTRLRRVIATRFTPKFVTSFEAGMTSTCAALLDSLLGTRELDLVTQFAQPMSATLIADILGIPDERRDDFRNWSTKIVASLSSRHDPAEAAEAEKTRVEFVKYLRELVAERRHDSPKQDIISLLLRANEQEVLTPKEVTAFCVLLLVAGFETTVNGLCNIVHTLARHPHAWDALVAAPDRLGAAAEEALRFDSPDQAFFRNTLSEVVIGGVTIPEKSKVMVSLGSANRDPSKFPDPDVVDIRRETTGHLAFGSGVHYCIGAPLARLQFGVVLRDLLRRVKRIDVTAEPVQLVTIITRGFHMLPLSLTPK